MRRALWNERKDMLRRVASMLGFIGVDSCCGGWAALSAQPPPKVELVGGVEA